MNKNSKWSNVFKAFRIILFIFIIVLFCFDYFNPSINYFSSENIFILCLAFVILIIDLFDSIQVGTILTINKEKQIMEKENKLLKDHNDTLLKMVNNINNKISVTNNYAEVKPATEEEKEKKIINDEIEKEEKQQNTSSLTEQHSPDNIEKLKDGYYQKSPELNNLKTQENLLNKYIHTLKLNNPTIIRDAKIIAKGRMTIFDCYIKDESMERFVEVSPYVPYIKNIDLNLEIIKEYNIINNTNAQIVLILPKDLFEKSHIKSPISWNSRLERIETSFKRQIENGTLIIVKL